METTVRELNQRTAQVLARVEAGETITVTKNGHPVAVLRPYGPGRGCRLRSPPTRCPGG
jgi:prevent-host-death family protein